MIEKRIYSIENKLCKIERLEMKSLVSTFIRQDQCDQVSFEFKIYLDECPKNEVRVKDKT